MDDERWRCELPVTSTGSLAKTNPQSVALFLMNHPELKDRRDVGPGLVRDVMHAERCKAPFRLIEPMLVMHLAHLEERADGDAR